MDTIHQILSWAGMTGIILAVVISAYLAFVRHEHTSDISVRLNGILMALSTVLFVAGRLHGTSQSATVLPVETMSYCCTLTMAYIFTSSALSFSAIK